MNLPEIRKALILAVLVVAVVFYCFFGKYFHPHSVLDLFLLCAVAWVITKEESRRIRVVHMISIISALLVINLFWHFYRTPLTFFDILSIYNIWEYSKSLFLALIILLFFVLASFFRLVIISAKRAPIRALLLLIIIALIALAWFEREDWNPLRNYRTQGYLITTIADTLYKAQIFLHQYEGPKDFYLSRKFESRSKPNINILILESLVTPEFLQPNLKYQYDKTFDWKSMDAPSFSGESARAEFEILCGVPSLKEPMVEFNYIKAPLPCLPSVLQDLGYTSYVTNANRRWVYNASKVYKKLGFNQQHWPMDPYPDDPIDAPGGYLYDGVLLAQNLERLKGFSEPFLNYVVGAYGHFPFQRDKKRRPDVLTAGNDVIERLANIHLYREKEVRKWLNRIGKRYPGAINIICGDHLPYVTGHNYKQGKYKTFCYMNLEESAKNLYTIPSRLLEELGCAECAVSLPDIKKEYRKLLRF